MPAPRWPASWLASAPHDYKTANVILNNDQDNDFCVSIFSTCVPVRSGGLNVVLVDLIVAIVEDEHQFSVWLVLKDASRVI